VDVCAATKIDKRHFREYMTCLESAGLAKLKGLKKDEITIYAWAVPRALPALPLTVEVTRAGTTFAGCSPELAALLKHYRVRIPTDFEARAGTIAELERLARVTREAELALRAYVKGHANCDVYKEESKERYFEKNPPPPPFPVGSNGDAPQQPPKAEEEDGSLYKKFQENYPKQHFDEAKARAEFKRLEPVARERALARLLDPYLACPRWLDGNGRYIPLASNFLHNREFDAEPPPLIQPMKARHETASEDQILEFLQQSRKGVAS